MRFTRLTVLRAVPDRVGANGRTRSQWECRCDCGNLTTVVTDQLKNNSIISCGCLNREKSSRRWLTHGLSRAGLRAYTTWAKIRERVLCKSCKSYAYYGGRGIRLCRRWQSFQNFYADMGDPPEGMTIHRKDNDGDYTPKNCEWADNFTQARNKRSNINLTHEGKTMCAAEWSLVVGIDANTLRSRFHKGWSPEAIITTPVIH